MSLTLIIILIISGLFVGFINTLSAGGTVISIALYLALGIPAPIANATNRIGVLIQSFSTGLMMKREGLIDNKKTLRLAIPTMLGALVGSLLASVLTQNIFSYFMGAILILMIFFLFMNPSKLSQDDKERLSKPVSLIKYIAFFGIGIYGGFIQVGTGFLLMTAGTMLIGYDIIKTNALKVSIMFLYTLVAMTVFIFDSQIYWSYGLVHSIGSIAGSWVATKFALKKGANFVRWVVVIVIILTALNLFGIINLKSFFIDILHYNI
jgi:uncharacterized protein